MRFLIRPYNADGPRLLSAAKNKARFDGIVVDAHIAKFAGKAVTGTRAALEAAGAEFLLDPVTHKMRRSFFRAKKRSFGKLPYFFSADYGENSPPLSVLDARAAEGAKKVLDLQDEFEVTSYLSPYLHVDPTSFMGKKLTPFSVGRKWAAEFLTIATDKPAFLSLCIAAECLTDPDSLVGIQEFLSQHKPAGVYLLLFDWDLGASPVLTTGVLEFLQYLRTSGVKRIIYSHAPTWVYFLAPHGVTDFVSGINYLTTLKKEYLEREEDIGGIVHNYYIPRRFCRMTPAEAEEAINLDIIEACECPACAGSVPVDVNLIREHYIHTRAAETQELRKAKNKSDLLRGWAEETENFLAQVESEELKVLGDPNPTQWRMTLP